MKLFKLYNCHFSNSNNWDFTSVIFNQLMNSYNVNVRIIFDLPLNSHCWLVEELSGAHHAKKLIYKKYIGFLNNLKKNKRKSVNFLLSYVIDNVQSFTGRNIRKILMDTDTKIVPGVTKKVQLQNYQVHATPESEQWRLPLLESLLAIKNDEWEVLFCEEEDDITQTIEENDIEAFIYEVCTS